MHEIASSLLERAIQVGGETNIRSQAHENDMVLMIAEEEALECRDRSGNLIAWLWWR